MISSELARDTTRPFNPHESTDLKIKSSRFIDIFLFHCNFMKVYPANLSISRQSCLRDGR